MKRLPGPSSTRSASAIASSEGGCAAGSGSSQTRRQGPAPEVIALSPQIRVPSARSAQRLICARVDGSTLPRILSTRLHSWMARSKLPVRSVSAARKRFPKECPVRSPPSKRCWKRRPISDSSSASATRQLRMSPGGSTPSSRRRRPDDPPSSATVTMAVMSSERRLSPRSSEESPVPPPRAAMWGRRFTPARWARRWSGRCAGASRARRGPSRSGRRASRRSRRCGGARRCSRSR